MKYLKKYGALALCLALLVIPLLLAAPGVSAASLPNHDLYWIKLRDNISYSSSFTIQSNSSLFYITSSGEYCQNLQFSQDYFTGYGDGKNHTFYIFNSGWRNPSYQIIKQVLCSSHAYYLDSTEKSNLAYILDGYVDVHPFDIVYGSSTSRLYLETSLTSCTISVDSTGFTLSSESGHSVRYDYTGSSTFAGVSLSSSLSLDFPVGSSSTVSFNVQDIKNLYVIDSSLLDYDLSVYDISGAVVIDNVSSADPIEMTVTSTGATFQLTDQTLSYIYTGTEVFAGFATIASGSATYTPGNTYMLNASATSLYAKEKARPTYAASLYGLTGSLIGSTGVSYSPLTLQVTSTGARITRADGDPLVYTYTGSEIFAGFSTSPGGDPVYLPGESYTLSGAYTSLYAKEIPRPTYSITLYDVSDPEPVGNGTFLDPIHIKVTSSGAFFSSGVYSFEYVYSGSEIFTGFATSAGGTPVYLPGNSYTITAPSTVLYAVEKDRPVYTLTLYDEAGQPVVGPLTSYEPISFSIGRKSATFYVNGSEAGSWSYSGSDSFIGFAISPDSEDVPYRPGSSYTPTSLDTKLYVVSRFIDPGVIGDILDVFTGLGDVSVSLLLLLCGLFWAADTGLTFLGVAALVGAGIGICLLCFYLVTKYRS